MLRCGQVLYTQQYLRVIISDRTHSMNNAAMRVIISDRQTLMAMNSMKIRFVSGVATLFPGLYTVIGAGTSFTFFNCSDGPLRQLVTVGWGSILPIID